MTGVLRERQRASEGCRYGGEGRVTVGAAVIAVMCVQAKELLVATGGWERDMAGVLLEGARLCCHLAFRFLASGSMR